MTTQQQTEMDVLNSLYKEISDALGIEIPDGIGRETRFFADLGLASIDAVVLAEALQRRYGRRLPFDSLMADLGRKAQRDLTLGDLADFLVANLGEEAARTNGRRES